MEWFAARGLGPHWSIGLDGDVESSTFGNTSFAAGAAPAVELSVFPYREYATRQFVVQYQLGVEHARYTEVTLFDRLQETHARHELSADLDQRQRWGSLEAGIEWSQYLHDRSKYRLEVEGELSLRIVRGLAVQFDAQASRIRDQLSLPTTERLPGRSAAAAARAPEWIRGEHLDRRELHVRVALQQRRQSPVRQPRQLIVRFEHMAGL